MNKDKELSVSEGRRQHFMLLMEEWDHLVNQSQNTPIFETVECLLGCGSKPELAFIKRNSRFVLCPDCGMLFLNPQLTESALAEHFASSPAWEVWSKIVLASSEQQDFDSKKYLAALKTVKQLSPIAHRVLDVGSGSGFFLSLARLAGFEAQGIEPSSAACRVAENRYGVSLFNGPFADYKPAGGSFDLITFWASLEYFKYPRIAIEKAVNLLVPGGLLLVLISGNAHSLVMRMLKERCVGFLFNRPWYFTPDALDKLAVQVSERLKLISRKSIIPSLDVIESYLCYGDPYGKKPKRPLFNPSELEVLNGLIETKDMGYKFLSIYRKGY